MTPQAWILLIAFLIAIVGCYGIDHQNDELKEQNSRLSEENKRLKMALMERGRKI